MSYQVLARKWRPRSFQQMVGQEHVLRMLMNALDTQRLHHAYLFTGTRGVGKTTLGRLLAKCLNCETGVTSQPCDQCSACQSIDTGRFLDLLEIDAASRTKVEDTRELLENVQYAPTQGRYKVYLIDEVHMLSGHSFNALLKTLEEPPAHVKFLLATTDPKRLPITILSRCLQFNLKRVPVEQIAAQLQKISQAENITFEEEALTQLAEAADGSMRDALSLLDQAIAYCRDTLTSQQVRLMLGHVEQEAILRLLNALADRNGQEVMTIVATLAEQAPDFGQILESVISLLHQIAVVQVIKTETKPAIMALAERMPLEDVQLFYQIALTGRRDLPLAISPRQGFEMTLLRLLAFQPATDKMPVAAAPAAKPKAATPTPPPTTTPAPSAAASIPSTQDWTDILTQLQLTGMTLALASNCALLKIQENHVELALSKKHEPMLNKKLQTRMEEALSQLYQRQMSVTIQLTGEELHTAAKQKDTDQKNRHATAVNAIQADHQVKKIMDVFDATLDVNSIKAID